MTDHQPVPAKPRDVLHVLSGGVLAFGIALRRGDTIQLSAAMVASTMNAEGHSWLDDISEAGQVKRWGEVRFGLGPWPEGLHKWLAPHDAVWLDEFNSAREDALRQPTEAQRHAALAEVKARFGDAPQSSRTLRSVR